FPAHMQRLCDVGLNQRISRNSVRAYRERYSREAVFAEYDAIFGAAPPVEPRAQGERQHG
ncbi:MAG TPA: hypothetical protein VFP36_06135, partial [Usitatibacter sp.]|nr:hypothetical protein [Usitatibacter sp.]